ncbi:DUF2149 domain-containing protein [Methanosphaera sp. ISO3-F5]|uniref:DUF2149 domain-containing protein n=1 Tax=Methanosphaera sp. ISO3-F5 TaxID=1452353 RepID=UPI002B262EC5|nr:DUF2149 domain-containing protein [Methanosphaera sp. ISO3-F5]WQH64223.1 DUF2149 domain-containing protein [Methanosphaera sp. ISO3-F5]
MSLRRSRLRETEEDIDPMSSATNMTDIMLVLAVGFLIFAVMSTGLQNIMFSDMSPQEKQAIMQQAQQTVEVEQGQEIKDLPESIEDSSSGYTKTGTVYTDPKTGRQYMTTS